MGNLKENTSLLIVTGEGSPQVFTEAPFGKGAEWDLPCCFSPFPENSRMNIGTDEWM